MGTLDLVFTEIMVVVLFFLPLQHVTWDKNLPYREGALRIEGVLSWILRRHYALV